MKVIIGIVIVVILVLIFRGMGSDTNTQPANPSPAANQPNQPDAGAAKPIVPATAPVQQISSKGLKLLSNIRCDLKAATVTFTFTNGEEKKLKILMDDIIQLSPNVQTNMVRFAVNNRWPNAHWNRGINCGGKTEFAPGESADCTMDHLVLRAPSQADELTGMRGQNELRAENMNAAYKSYNDLQYFTCA